jgi:hypothetical protein
VWSAAGLAKPAGTVQLHSSRSIAPNSIGAGFGVEIDKFGIIVDTVIAYSSVCKYCTNEKQDFGPF